MFNQLTAKLNYAWRLFGTGFSFFCFGLGSLILGVIVFPVLYLFKPLITLKESARYVIHKSFQTFIWMMKSMGVLDYKVEGDINRLNQSGTLILANHPTLLDVVFIISFMPNVNCVVKQGLWRNPLTRAVVHSAGYIRNDTPKALINHCVDNLNEGESLIIFPEGTRGRQGKLGKFKRGAAQIAVRSQANIVPIIISCHPNTLSKQEKWYQIPVTKPLFCFKISTLDSELHHFSKLDYDDFTRSKAVRQFNTRLYEYFKINLKPD